MLEDHIPKAIPRNIKDLLYQSMIEGQLDQIHMNFYSSSSVHNYFQGNTLDKLQFVNLPDSKVDTKQAIIASNPCDTDLNNENKRQPKVSYCRVISLEGYKKLLREHSGMTNEETNNHIITLKKQLVSDLVYLPKGRDVAEDRVAILSQIINCDIDYVESKKPRVVSVLSQKAYYLLLTKLSIHFLRFGDMQNLNND